MAVVVVVTPGAANANSYGSLAEGDAYFEGHPYASGWVSLTTDEKNRQLVHTTRLLDTMPWKGAAASATQRLRFPRTGLLTANGYTLGSTTVPEELKAAQFEFCSALAAKDLTKTDSIRQKGISSIKAGPVSLSFAGDKLLSQEKMGLPSSRAYLSMIPDVVKAMIPPHWLKTVEEQKAEEGAKLFFQPM